MIMVWCIWSAAKSLRRRRGESLSGGPGTGLVPDLDGGGVWTGLFSAGLAYFRKGPIRNLPLRDTGTASRVLDLSRDRDGSLWAATESGLSRIRNGRVATLTTANGLPCNAVHWIIEDDHVFLLAVHADAGSCVSHELSWTLGRPIPKPFDPTHDIRRCGRNSPDCNQ